MRACGRVGITRVGQVLALALGVALMPPVQAQSGRDIQAAIKASPEGRQGSKAGCSFRAGASDQWRRADVDGDGQDEVIASYVTEGCGGGNYWGLSVGVFKQTSSGLKLVGSGHVEGSIEKISVTGSRIVVQTLGYGPEDARCCPTKPASETFVWSNGALRQAAPGRR